jgi:tetratricopeptide (TPR) repeat protein
MAERGRFTLDKLDKYASVVSAIIAVLTFSQGNRIVSYVFVIIGYVLMARFLWRVMTQKSAVEIGIETPRPLPEEWEYSRPQPWRWLAGITLVVLTLISFGWVAVNGWGDYQAWRQTREGLLFPRAEENELLVIIAQFDNRSTKGIDPTQRIYDRLRKELDEAGITNARLEIAPEIADLDEAREIGERHGAIFVIWGWFDDVGFTPNFTIVKERVLAQFVVKGMELKEVPLEPPEDFSLYVREGLTSQMAYFSTLTIGQVYFWDWEYDKAFNAFDRAIEIAQQGRILEGLADIYLYRGATRMTVWDDTYMTPMIVWDNAQQAIADFGRAIELRPDFAEAYSSRGFLHAEQGEYDLAIADYNKAIELRPDFAEVYLSRGRVHKMRGEKEEAIRDFELFLELSEDEIFISIIVEQELKELRGE